MVRRTIGTNTYNLAYDVENRLTQVSGAAAATFGYEGDGKRVMGIEGGTTTVYIGNYFEWKGSTSTMVKYYYAGAERVAMRSGTADPLWLVGDHLGSTSVAANYDGTLYTRQGYKAWGEQRFIQGISPLPSRRSHGWSVSPATPYDYLDLSPNPFKYSSIARAAWRPAAMAVTIRSAPRTSSPAA
jgi:hypothetical protein